MSHVVVVELGSTFVRAGIGGESSPRCCHKLMHERVCNPHALYKYFLGLLTVTFVDWLGVRPKDARVLIIEHLLEEKSCRDTVISVLFHELQVQSVSMQPDIFMPILATRTNCGIVMDIGEHETRVLALFDGRPIISSLNVARIGVAFARRLFCWHLQNCGNVSDLQKSEVEELFGRVCCCCCNEGNAHDITCHAVGETERSVLVPKQCRTWCLQYLVTGDISLDSFTEAQVADITEMLDQDDVCLAEMLLRCLEHCSVDIRRKLMENIVFSGGGSDIPGVSEAVCREVVRVLTQPRKNESYRFQSLRSLVEIGHSLRPVATPFAPSLLSWVGGSLFASNKANSKRFVSSKDVMTIPDQGAAGTSREDISRRKFAAKVVAPDWQSINRKDWTFVGPIL